MLKCHNCGRDMPRETRETTATYMDVVITYMQPGWYCECGEVVYNGADAALVEAQFAKAKAKCDAGHQRFTVKDGGKEAKFILVSHRPRGGKCYMAIKDDAALDMLIETLSHLPRGKAKAKDTSIVQVDADLPFIKTEGEETPQ